MRIGRQLLKLAIPHKAMEKITFGKDSLPGYLIGDVDDPAVIVIQEWWGVTEVSA